MSSTKSTNALKDIAAKKTEFQVDLKSIAKCQLLEVLQRQIKLASNAKALNRLPDQGKKILDYLEQIEHEVKRREKECDIAEAFAGLTLEQLNRLEWTKDVKKQGLNCPEDVYDGETNLLKILTTHSGAGNHTKGIKVKQKEELLVSERDIQDLYAVNLCNKVDNVWPKEKFCPYKTLNHANPLTGKERDHSFKCGETKIMGLEDSLKLLRTQKDRLREIQLQHAAERLRDKTHTLGDVMPTGESVQLYRETVDPDDEVEVRVECEFPIDFSRVN